jgi:hypothetical protein
MKVFVGGECLQNPALLPRTQRPETTVPRRDPGGGPVHLPCGSRNHLRLTHLRDNSCVLPFGFRALLCVLPPKLQHVVIIKVGDAWPAQETDLAWQASGRHVAGNCYLEEHRPGKLAPRIEPLRCW